MRWPVRTALALCVVAFGLAAPVVPGLAATCAGANAASTIRVSVVVDDGGASPRIGCIVVPARVRNGELQANGAEVLSARASQLGLPAPRWGNTGLLCAVDGAPATGCAEPGSGDNYVYWSYWQGESGQWVYSSLGPAYRAVRDGAIEGWRFGNGGGTGQDRAPRTPAGSARCPVVPAPTPTTTPAPPATSPPTGGGGGAVPKVPATPRPPGNARSTTTTIAAASPGLAAPPTTIVDPGAAPSTTIPVSDGSTTTTIEAEVEGTAEERGAASVEVPGDQDGGGGWTATAVGVGALGAAAVGLTVLGRRRRAAP